MLNGIYILYYNNITKVYLVTSATLLPLLSLSSWQTPPRCQVSIPVMTVCAEQTWVGYAFEILAFKYNFYRPLIMLLESNREFFTFYRKCTVLEMHVYLSMVFLQRTPIPLMTDNSPSFLAHIHHLKQKTKTQKIKTHNFAAYHHQAHADHKLSCFCFFK